MNLCTNNYITLTVKLLEPQLTILTLQQNRFLTGKVKPTAIASGSSTEHIYVLYPTSVTVWSLQGFLLSIFGHQHLLGAYGIAIDSQGTGFLKTGLL